MLHWFLKDYPEDFSDYPIREDIFYLLASGCLFPCVKHDTMMSIHAAIPPDLRGKHAVSAARQVFRWIFKHTDCEFIQAQADKPEAKRFAALCGMTRTHENNYTYYRIEKWAVL